MFRRETMIALRARRTAVQIALQIAHPRLESPEPPLATVPAPPIDTDEAPEPDFERREALRSLEIACAIIVVSVGSFVLLWWMLYWPR